MIRVERECRLFFAASFTGLVAAAFLSCEPASDGRTVIRFPASALGSEGAILREQIARFEKRHPDISIEVRQTPDAANERHQLYVQWLNAHAPDPDVLQLDVVWTAEFAAAGWVLPIDELEPDTRDFFPAALDANRWDGRLYALPWFIDVGMLYYRTDLVPTPPQTFEELVEIATSVSVREGAPKAGFLWQGARYEGLICVFLEILGGFGGRIMDDGGKIDVDSDHAVAALSFLRDLVRRHRISPDAVLAFQEEQTRFGFQNGDAVFLRNWPYAYPLMDDKSRSAVAGKFAVTTMPRTAAGMSTSALGGSQLAINAHSDHPEAAYRFVSFLLEPEQMLERARITGQYPPRRSLYDDPALAAALPVSPARVRELIDAAEPRPVTPVYAELSDILQVWVHRALTGQAEPRAALLRAGEEMRALLVKAGLEKERAQGRGDHG